MKNLILTGFMATGKSAVGQLLAEALGYRFLDTDQMIEAQMGKSIPRIFQEDGETHFRQLEGEVLEEKAGSEGLVIASGGGMIMDEDNYQRLHQLGPIVCLQATPEVILERAGRKKNRPLLAVPNPLEKIRALLAARREAYARADFCVDTSQKTPEEVVSVILDSVRPK